MRLYYRRKMRPDGVELSDSPGNADLIGVHLPEGKPNHLVRLVAEPKTGHETFHANARGLGLTLSDFWRWSLSDLVSNATRGRLAEFIVADALGISTRGVR